MEIYAEYFFMENFIADAAIAGLTLDLWRRRPGKLRFLSAVLLMTLYSFIIFLPFSALLSCLPVKLIFSAGVVRILFNDAGLRGFAQGMLTFFGAGMMMGGTVSFAVYALKIRGFSSLGMMYVSPGSYPVVMLCIGGAWVFARVFFSLLVEKRKKEERSVGISVTVGGNSCELKALLDTGNTLRDPLNGYPVMVVEACSAACLLKGGMEGLRLRVIPYTAVGTEAGTLLGVEVDQIMIRDGESEYAGRPAVLAFYNGKLGLGEGCSVILHPDILRREAVKVC